MFIREIELGDDEEDLALVQVDQKNEGDTGVVVWDAAIVLSKYLETIKDDLANKSAIGNIEMMNNIYKTSYYLKSLAAAQVLLDSVLLPWAVTEGGIGYG